MFMSGLLLNSDFMSVRIRHVSALKDIGLTGFRLSVLNGNFLVYFIRSERNHKIFLVIGHAIFKYNINIVNGYIELKNATLSQKLYCGGVA